MSLQTLLDSSLAYEGKKQGISEQRLLQKIDDIRDKIAFFRQYPDLFIDFIQGPNGTFKFLYYQMIYTLQSLDFPYQFQISNYFLFLF